MVWWRSYVARKKTLQTLRVPAGGPLAEREEAVPAEPDAVAGSLGVTLGAATLASTGTALTVASLTNTLGDATLAAAGTAPVVGSLSKTLDAATLSATGEVVFTPVTLALTGYWDNSYSGLPWAGLASAGSSGGNDQVDHASTAPATGSTVNGYVAAAFDGTTSWTDAEDSVATMLGIEGWSYACLLKTNTLDADTNVYANNPLWTDDQQIVGVTVSDAGIHAFQYDSAATEHKATATWADDTWALVQARINSGSGLLQIRVNNGAWQSSGAAPADFHANLGTTIWLGRTGYSQLDGEKLIEMFAAAGWDDATADAIGEYIQDRYALSLGF